MFQYKIEIIEKNICLNQVFCEVHKMYSVTQRIALLRYENKMPRGGYLSLKDFKITNLYDDKILFEDENLQPGTVGTVVDYLTRFVMGTPKEDAFDISMRGALKTREFIIAEQLLNEINGLDSKSVTAACKLVGFDVCYRAGSELYKPVSDINPNNQTIENIITMVNRSKSFWQKFGPVVKDGICFNGGYSPIVSKGDADFLSKDTIWEFKVIKTPPKPDYRLQLLMYYIMGVVSRQNEFE